MGVMHLARCKDVYRNYLLAVGHKEASTARRMVDVDRVTYYLATEEGITDMREATPVMLSRYKDYLDRIHGRTTGKPLRVVLSREEMAVRICAPRGKPGDLLG